MKPISPRLLVGFLMLILLSGCATDSPETPTPEPSATLVPPTSAPIQPTATFAPPTETPFPTSCEEVDGVCLKLAFNGEGCTYAGPTVLKPGQVTLLFFNESEGEAAVNFVIHTGDETIQDAIDYIGEEPAIGKHAPDWTNELGTWWWIRAGKHYVWEGNLKTGTYHMVCARGAPLPLGAWFGTGITVED